MNEGPLVSGLCVTRGRVALLKRAIRSFKDQTYTNKELVIVYESDDLLTKEFLSGLPHKDILKVEVPAHPNPTLGELRNLAVAECNGEYFCQWDDDDWSHNARLSFQMDVIRQSGLPACMLIHWLIFDTGENQAYLSNSRLWEGSLVCRKSLIRDELKYEESKRGEDTSLIGRLFSKNLIFPAIMPQLYIYVYHGKNVWTKEHWGRIFGASRKLSDESSLIIKDILDGKYTGQKASRILDRISE